MKLLNLFFHVTHVVIIGLTLIGWAFKRTRHIHLLLVILTLLSWIALGYFFGWGYCFWTDWHWEVRHKLGKPSPPSYVKLLADSVTGRSWDAAFIDSITVIGFALIVIITMIVNIRDYRAPS